MKHSISKSRWLQVCVMVFAMIGLTMLAKKYEYPDIQVNYVEEIIIPDMEGEYEFLYLTDLHLALPTREDAGVYGDAMERIKAFSNERGTVSAKQLPQWVAYANEHQFDAVLMGGDMIDYYTDENAFYLAEQIKKLEMPCLFTLGNHEWFSPWEGISLKRISQSSLKETSGISSEDFAETGVSVLFELFLDGQGAFQVLEYEDFVICAIDNEEYQVNEASLTAMREWLLQNPTKPVILLAHVPFYTEQNRSLLETTMSVWGQALVIGTGEGTRDTTAVSREFIEMILGENSPVIAVLTGDNHFYHKGNLTDSIVQWVGAPAYEGDGMIIKIKGN